MPDNELPQPHDLPNKPLVEVIFELRWDLNAPGPGLPLQDLGFRIALGRFYDAVRKDYPQLIDLPTAQVPEDMTAYAVRHQFRVAADCWPLIQLGPGILTVNDTAGYAWSLFRPRILNAVQAIFQAYPSDIRAFRPSSVRLRYIDAIEFDPQSTDPISFLKNYLHTSVAIEPLLFNDLDRPNSAQQLRMSLTFPLTRPKGAGSLGFANGAHEGKPSIIMETVIRSDAGDVPSVKEDFATWVDEAHAVTNKWFFTLCRGPLLARFEEAHADDQPSICLK